MAILALLVLAHHLEPDLQWYYVVHRRRPGCGGAAPPGQPRKPVAPNSVNIERPKRVDYGKIDCIYIYIHEYFACYSHNTNKTVVSARAYEPCRFRDQSQPGSYSRHTQTAQGNSIRWWSRSNRAEGGSADGAARRCQAPTRMKNSAVFEAAMLTTPRIEAQTTSSATTQSASLLSHGQVYKHEKNLAGRVEDVSIASSSSHSSP